MLISITESAIGQAQGTGEAAETAKEALELIARGRLEGKHLLFGKRDVMGELSSMPGLGERAQRVYGRVMDRLPQKASLVGSLTRRMEVVADDEELFPRSSRVGAATVVRVPLCTFRDSTFIQPTVLLTENLRDARAALLLGHAFAIHDGLGTIRLVAQERAGGGATTAETYAAIQAAGIGLCLCVVDSDRKCPSAALGSTARSVKRVDDASKPLCEVHTLEAREMENLLPTKLVAGIATGNRQREAGLIAIEQIEAIEPEIRLYLDLKRGTTLRSMLEDGPDSPQARYWLSKIPLLHGAAGVHASCLAASECREERSNPCGCRISEGFGDNMLENCLDGPMQKRGAHKLGETMRGAVQGPWEALGADVVAWCCAGRELRS